MAELPQVVFSQTGHFHDGTAVNAVLQHGKGYFKGCLTLPLLKAALFTELDALRSALLDALFFKLLCDGHECISVLRHTLCQFAYEGFSVGRFASLHDIGLCRVKGGKLAKGVVPVIQAASK